MAYGLPDGEFVVVMCCADCGAELNRSRVITAKEYTAAILSGPMCAPACPNGCRSTCADLNLNTIDRWERPDGTPIARFEIEVPL